MKLIWLAALMCSSALALTPAEAGKSLRLTLNASARFCTTLAEDYKGITGFSVGKPFFLVKEHNLFPLTVQAELASGVGTFAAYRTQTWEDRGNGFLTLRATDATRKGFLLFFDTRDPYRTDVCIQAI